MPRALSSAVVKSRRHPLVMRCRALARGRGAPGDLLIDGVHLVREARASGIHLSQVLVDERRARTDEVAPLVTTLPPASVVLVSSAVFPDLSPVRQSSGVVAIGRRPVHAMAGALAGRRPLVLVLVDVQDPGNVGAAIRAADAGGATGVIVAGVSADPWSWKALRGAMGSAFRLPLVREPDVEAVLRQVRSAGLAIVAAAADGETPLQRARLQEPTAILVGSEGAGLPAVALDAASARVAIPMRPPVESLNVAVAAALLVYEARRSRAEPHPLAPSPLAPNPRARF